MIVFFAFSLRSCLSKQAEAVLSGLPGCTPSAYPLLAARAVVPTTPAPAATGNMFDVVMIGSNDGGGGEDDEWLYTSGAACALWCRSRRKVFRVRAIVKCSWQGGFVISLRLTLLLGHADCRQGGDSVVLYGKFVVDWEQIFKSVFENSSKTQILVDIVPACERRGWVKCNRTGCTGVAMIVLYYFPSDDVPVFIHKTKIRRSVHVGRT